MHLLAKNFCEQLREKMILDIQENSYTLFDPEIATAKLMDEESSEIMFCAGNLIHLAICQFF